MNKLNYLFASLLPLAALACSTPKAAGPDTSPETTQAGPDTSPKTDRAGPNAKPETERAGPDTKPETERAGPSAKIDPKRTGPASGVFGPSNINYSASAPKTMSLVVIDSRVAKECGLGEREIYFAHDSAAISKDAEEKLSDVAQCLKKGQFSTMKIAVVGFTDPQGSEEHNKELGLDRAERVVSALRERGVREERLAAITGGETGSEEDESGWPRARKVAIVPYELATR